MLSFDDGGSSLASQPAQLETRAATEDQRDQETEGCADPYWQNVLAALAVSGGDSRALAAAERPAKDTAEADEAPDQTSDGPSAFSF